MPHKLDTEYLEMLHRGESKPEGKWRLLRPNAETGDPEFYWSDTPGVLGGNWDSRHKDTLRANDAEDYRLFGRVGNSREEGGCVSALTALENSATKGTDRHYSNKRVFFASEDDARACGFRPCGTCQREKFQDWKQVQQRTPGNKLYEESQERGAA